MAKSVYTFIYIILLISNINCQDGSALKARAATRFTNYFSEFFTSTQAIGLFDLTLNMAYEGNNASSIGTELMNHLMSNLTASQLSKVTSFGIGLPFYYSGGISGFLSLVSDFLSNNLSAFVNQISAEMSKMKVDGKDKQYCINQGYYMGLSFFTSTKFQTIFCRFKGKFTVAEWNKLYTNLTKFIKVDLYESVCV
uniref:Uncharacterized protein n=1 Tax=Parastrongyloides trichosuri TaxID=131310 RepID=A0A0N4Z627_PARTI